MDRAEIEQVIDGRFAALRRDLVEEVRRMNQSVVEQVGREVQRFGTVAASTHAMNEETRRTLDQQKHENAETLRAAQRLLDGTVTKAVTKALEPVSPTLEDSKKLLSEVRQEQIDRQAREDERAKMKAQREEEERKKRTHAIERREFILKACGVAVAIVTPVLAAAGAYLGMRGKPR